MNRIGKELLIYALELTTTFIVLLLLLILEHFLLNIQQSSFSRFLNIMIAFSVTDILAIKVFERSSFSEREKLFSYNDFIIKLLNKQPKIKLWIICVIGFVLDILVSSPFQIEENPMANRPIWVVTILGLVFVPLFETFLFQYMIIEIVSWITKKTSGKEYIIFAGIVSAIIFSLSHDYSPAYMIVTLFSGLYLSFVYIYFRIRNESKTKGYLATVLMHFILNLIPFIQTVF